MKIIFVAVLLAALLLAFAGATKRSATVSPITTGGTPTFTPATVPPTTSTTSHPTNSPTSSTSSTSTTSLPTQKPSPPPTQKPSPPPTQKPSPPPTQKPTPPPTQKPTQKPTPPPTPPPPPPCACEDDVEVYPAGSPCPTVGQIECCVPSEEPTCCFQTCVSAVAPGQPGVWTPCIAVDGFACVQGAHELVPSEECVSMSAI